MQTTFGRWRGLPAGTFLVSVLLLAGCGGEQPFGTNAASSGDLLQLAAGPAAAPKATGLVQVVWPGGMGRVIPPGEEKLAFADFNAFPATTAQPVRGTFIYRVLNADSTAHREIIATVTDAVVDVSQNKAWFAGLVISDVKICSGGSCDGDDGCSHDDGGCGDDGSHDDGGCSGGGSSGGSDGGCSDGSHDDGDCSDGASDGSHDDGGCSDGGSDGGCSDGSHDDGGCSDGGSDGGCSDGSHDDGGCSDGGSDGGHDDGGCAGGGSDGGHGGPGGIPGKDPRVGQVVLVKVHDVGTPGTNGDGIAWKWLAPGTVLDLSLEPKQMCKKEIIGGNLVVHPVPGS